MSSILKALQRLEKDRAGARDHEPALSGELSGELASPEPAASGRARTGRWLGLGLALVVVAGGAWLGAPWLAARFGGAPAVVVAEAPPPQAPSRAAVAPEPAAEARTEARRQNRVAWPSDSPRPQVAKTPPPVAAPAEASPRNPAQRASQPSPFQENAAEKPSAPPLQAKASPRPSAPPVEAKASPRPSAPPVEAKASPRPSAPPVEAKAPPPPSAPPLQAKASPPPSVPPVEAKASPRPSPARTEPSPAPSRAKTQPVPKPAPSVRARVEPSANRVEPSAKPKPSASAEAARSPAAAKPNSAGKAAALAPELAVLRTSWHPSPDRRLARVRVTAGGVPRELREGDTEGALHVVKIEPSAVVFTFQGQEIRRSVGK